MELAKSDLCNLLLCDCTEALLYDALRHCIPGGRSCSGLCVFTITAQEQKANSGIISDYAQMYSKSGKIRVILTTAGG